MTHNSSLSVLLQTGPRGSIHVHYRLGMCIWTLRVLVWQRAEPRQALACIKENCRPQGTTLNWINSVETWISSCELNFVSWTNLTLNSWIDPWEPRGPNDWWQERWFRRRSYIHVPSESLLPKQRRYLISHAEGAHFCPYYTKDWVVGEIAVAPMTCSMRLPNSMLSRCSVALRMTPHELEARSKAREICQNTVERDGDWTCWTNADRDNKLFVCFFSHIVGQRVELSNISL